MSLYPDPRASVAEKKTAKWYMQMADYVIGLAVRSNDKIRTKEYLNAANGIISTKDFEYVLKTYISADDLKEAEIALNAETLGKLRDVDIITPIKEKYMGEFINAYHNYQVYSLDPEVVLKRNADLGDQVEKLMFDKLNAKLAEVQGQNDPKTGKPVQPDIDIKSFVEDFLDNWIDETVIKEQDSLELLNAVVEAKRKYIDAYFYWWACEEVYTYRKLVGNDVHFEIVSPTEYYRVDSGKYFVEDDDFGMRRREVTIQELIDTYYNKMDDGLTEDQVVLLKRVANNERGGVGYLTEPIRLEFDRQFPAELKIGADVAFTKQGQIVIEDHYIFKTEIKKGILTYTDTDGEVKEMDVDETYVLNKKAGDISIEWIYINQMWEGWRFGNGSLGIYIPPRPVQLQRELLSNSSVCKSPYNGLSYIHKSSIKKPIPFRIRDNQALYIIYTLLEERWSAKFKSWLMLPESILADSKTMKTEERLAQADIDSLFPFNDANLRENPNAVNYVKEVATIAVIKYLEVLNNIKKSIKGEAWELANMNDSRFGGNNQYKGKAVSEYDYNQAQKGTVWSLEMFDAFRQRDYMANLDFSRVAWIDGKQGSFVDPSTKELKVVAIDGEAHLGANVGIFIANSAELNQQADALKQLAFSMGQNDDPEVAAEAITNKNISKLKEVIKEASKAKKAFQLQMSTAAEQAKQQTAQITMQDNEAQRKHEMDMLTMELDAQHENEVLRSDTELEINRAKLQIDTNGNGYIDKTEADPQMAGVLQAKQLADTTLKNRQQAVKEIGLAHKMKMDKQRTKTTK